MTMCLIILKKEINKEIKEILKKDYSKELLKITMYLINMRKSKNILVFKF